MTMYINRCKSWGFILLFEKNHKLCDTYWNGILWQSMLNLPNRETKCSTFIFLNEKIGTPTLTFHMWELWNRKILTTCLIINSEFTMFIKLEKIALWSVPALVMATPFGTSEFNPTDKGRDYFTWNLTQRGPFMADSMHLALTHTEIPVDNNHKIWRSRISLEVKFSIWYLRQCAVLIKDNLTRYKCHGSMKCSFCHHNETTKHFFLQRIFHAHYIASHPNCIRFVSAPQCCKYIWSLARWDS